MIDKKFKRVVIREGVILLCLILIFLAYLFMELPNNWVFNVLILWLVLIGYPVYLYFRFIVWVMKKNNEEQKPVKIRWFNKPQSIYCFSLLFGVFVLPLLWLTPFTTQNRKILFSFVMALCLLANFQERIPLLWKFAYLLMAVLWFYNTEPNPKLKP